MDVILGLGLIIAIAAAGEYWTRRGTPDEPTGRIEHRDRVDEYRPDDDGRMRRRKD